MLCENMGLIRRHVHCRVIKGCPRLERLLAAANMKRQSPLFTPRLIISLKVTEAAFPGRAVCVALCHINFIIFTCSNKGYAEKDGFSQNHPSEAPKDGRQEAEPLPQECLQVQSRFNSLDSSGTGYHRNQARTHRPLSRDVEQSLGGGSKWACWDRDPLRTVVTEDFSTGQRLEVLTPTRL